VLGTFFNNISSPGRVMNVYHDTQAQYKTDSLPSLKTPPFYGFPQRRYHSRSDIYLSVITTAIESSVYNKYAYQHHVAQYFNM
jgi:hypothetical protein